MGWLKLDDKFRGHPKVAPLTDAAFRLHVHGLNYCAEYETDGKLSRTVVETLTRHRSKVAMVADLIAAGLWKVDGEAGYEIHDYLLFNPARADLETERATKVSGKRAAGHLGGIASGIARRAKQNTKHGRSNGEAEHEANGKQNGSETKPRPVPIPTPAENTHHAREESPPDPRAWRRHLDQRWIDASGIAGLAPPGLIELADHVEAAAGIAGMDPPALFDRVIAEFQAYRASCSAGYEPQMAPRKLVEHWANVWERIAKPTRKAARPVEWTPPVAANAKKAAS